MNRLRLSCGLIIALPLCGNAIADTPSTINIPLGEIWGYSLAGTRHIRELEPDTAPNQELGNIASEIRLALAAIPNKRARARPGFVVPGSGSQALRQAHAVLVSDKNPPTVAASDPASLIFLSHQAAFDVELCSVTRNANRIEIRYRFIPHKVGVLRASFAVIPLGTLPPGDYSVSLTQQPKGGEPSKLLAKWGDQLVCNPFSFHVEEK